MSADEWLLKESGVAPATGHKMREAVVCVTCNSVFYNGAWHPVAAHPSGQGGEREA
jgi:hypothetical protein